MVDNILNINNGEIIQLNAFVVDELWSKKIIKWYKEYKMYGFDDEDGFEKALNIAEYNYISKKPNYY